MKPEDKNSEQEDNPETGEKLDKTIEKGRKFKDEIKKISEGLIKELNEIGDNFRRGINNPTQPLEDFIQYLKPSQERKDDDEDKNEDKEWNEDKYRTPAEIFKEDMESGVLERILRLGDGVSKGLYQSISKHREIYEESKRNISKIEEKLRTTKIKHNAWKSKREELESLIGEGKDDLLQKRLDEVKRKETEYGKMVGIEKECISTTKKYADTIRQSEEALTEMLFCLENKKKCVKAMGGSLQEMFVAYTKILEELSERFLYIEGEEWKQGTDYENQDPDAWKNGGDYKNPNMPEI